MNLKDLFLLIYCKLYLKLLKKKIYIINSQNLLLFNLKSNFINYIKIFYSRTIKTPDFTMSFCFLIVWWKISLLKEIFSEKITTQSLSTPSWWSFWFSKVN